LAYFQFSVNQFGHEPKSDHSRAYRPNPISPPPQTTKWSPQRDSNPRPTDSHPPPFSRPPANRGLGSGLSLHRIGRRQNRRPTQVGGVKSLHSPEPRQPAPSGVARDCPFGTSTTKP